MASVAGVYAPAFVERGYARGSLIYPSIRVSPEFMLRPSLSAVDVQAEAPPSPGVAGVYAPAFVERRTARSSTARPLPHRVSREFMLRPSLSGLSPWQNKEFQGVPRSVAGVYAPGLR